MKVLAITSRNDRSEQALYRGLHHAGIDIDVVCSPNAPEITCLSQAGIPVIPLKIRHRLDLLAVPQLRKLIRDNKIDILYMPRNHTLAIGLMSSCGFKTKHVAYRGTIGHISRWDPACWLTYLNSRIDKIACNSDAVLNYLLSMGIPRKRLARIYKGHDIKWYTTQKVSDLQGFGVPPSAIVIGFAGSIRPVKGIDVLIKAAEALTDLPHVHFLVVGEVRDRNITAMVDNSTLGARWHFTGFREDAAALMGACDIFVMPSLSREGFPRAVVEAM